MWWFLGIWGFIVFARVSTLETLDVQISKERQ